MFEFKHRVSLEKAGLFFYTLVGAPETSGKRRRSGKNSEFLMEKIVNVNFYSHPWKFLQGFLQG